MALKPGDQTPILAQEIWDDINQSLPPISSKNAAELFRFKRSPGQIHHGQLWSEIFRDEAWAVHAVEIEHLNPVLIGSGVNDIYHGYSRGEIVQPYMALVLADPKNNHWEGIFTHHSPKNRNFFFNCLRSNTFDESTMEVVLESGAILYIADALEIPGCLQIVPSPQRIFRLQRNKIESFYVFWEDDQHLLRKIESEQIFGLRGSASNMEDVRITCTLDIKDPQSRRILFIFWAGGTAKDFVSYGD